MFACVGITLDLLMLGKCSVVSMLSDENFAAHDGLLIRRE